MRANFLRSSSSPPYAHLTAGICLVTSIDSCGPTFMRLTTLRICLLVSAWAVTVATAGPSGHLCEQGIGSLPGPEIGEHHRGISREDPDQGNPGEVVPLPNHLRPDQDLRLSLLNGLEDLLVRPPSPRGVTIHPGHGRVRRKEPSSGLDLLRPIP